MKITSILILIIICIFPFFAFSGTSRKVLPYEKVFCEIRSKVGVHLARKYNMQLIGVGEGALKNVNFMSLSFSIDRNISKEDGRSILVNSVQYLLEEINKNEEIRQYLIIYPFDPEHVAVTVYINSPDPNKLYYPNLVVFSAYKGKLDYTTKNPETQRFGLEEEESFEDAVKILNGEMPEPPSEIK